MRKDIPPGAFEPFFEGIDNTDFTIISHHVHAAGYTVIGDNPGFRKMLLRDPGILRIYPDGLPGSGGSSSAIFLKEP